LLIPICHLLSSIWSVLQSICSYPYAIYYPAYEVFSSPFVHTHMTSIIQHMKCSPVHLLIPIWHPIFCWDSTSRMAVQMAHPAILGLFVGEMSDWYLSSFICRWHYTHEKCYFPSISWIWDHSHDIIVQSKFCVCLSLAIKKQRTIK